MKRDPLPQIRKPCPKSWDRLEGTERRRYCPACKLHVHNLAVMSPAEQEAFLGSPGQKCGAYPSGSQTLPLPAWKWARRLRRSRMLFAALTLFTAFFAGGCASTSRKDADCPTPDLKAFTPAEDEDGKSFMTVGIIVEERPLWKRVLWPWGD